MEIVPGKTVSVEIVAQPRSEAARKTLVRLFSKDPVVVRQARWQSRHRPSWQVWRRGGRMWHHQMKTQSPAKITVGNRVVLRATVDVLRDLESVSRFVSVTGA